MKDFSRECSVLIVCALVSENELQECGWCVAGVCIPLREICLPKGELAGIVQ